MGSVVKGLDKALESMDLQKVCIIVLFISILSFLIKDYLFELLAIGDS